MDTNPTPSVHTQALNKLEELREDLRRAYGTVRADQYEARLLELNNLDFALHKASRAMETATARIWCAEKFPIARCPDLAPRANKGGSWGDEI